VSKGHVLEDEGHKEDEGRGHLVDGHAVRALIPGGVNQGLKFGKDLAGLGRESFPGLTHPTHGNIPKAHDDGKEGIDILILLTTVSKNQGFSRNLRMPHLEDQSAGRKQVSCLGLTRLPV